MKSTFCIYCILFGILLEIEKGLFHDSFSHCPLRSDQNVFEVLPGYGWDSLRNIELGRVLAINYKSCRMTTDGRYLIPDGVSVISHKMTDMGLASEQFYHFKEYTPLDSETVTSITRSVYSAAGSYSQEYQEVKKARIQTGGFSTINRVVLDHKVYTVIVQRESTLHLSNEFSARVKELAAELIEDPVKTPSYADYLAELIVLQFGTHYIHELDAGASIAKTDILEKFERDWKPCAADTFMEYFGMSLPVTNCRPSIISFSSQSTYKKNIRSSKVISLGGPPLSPGSSIEAWRNGIGNNLVAIDRRGEFLHLLFTKTLFPDYPLPIVREMQKRVRKAIRRYFERNTIKGCMALPSSYFDTNANVDDKSMCAGRTSPIGIAGILQVCTITDADEAGTRVPIHRAIPHACSSFESHTPSVRNNSCPSESYQHLLLEWAVRICESHCTEYDLAACKPLCTTVRVQTYWCRSSWQKYALSFGGMYSQEPSIPNPLTHGYSCPTSFVAYQLGSNTSVICLSAPYQRGRLALDGMFSCLQGNPVTMGERSCRRGYSKHLGLIQQGCEVYYCAPSLELAALEPAVIQLPPYSHITSPNDGRIVFNDVSVGRLDVGAGQQWMKVHGGWKLSDEVEIKDIEPDSDRVLIKRFFERP